MRLLHVANLWQAPNIRQVLLGYSRLQNSDLRTTLSSDAGSDPLASALRRLLFQLKSSYSQAYLGCKPSESM